MVNILKNSLQKYVSFDGEIIWILWCDWLIVYDKSAYFEIIVETIECIVVGWVRSKEERIILMIRMTLLYVEFLVLNGRN